ncbi:MAG: M23 family metallopeptidase [Solirubrobacterales bacterium]|nr:M23 family metallopeptidase [Solirubrobacterales bacterium]
MSGVPRAVASQSGRPTMEIELLDAIFPIRGEHDLGQSATNGFGGARGHKGQDMFAGCGTPIVAARGGTVTWAAYHSRAGNYAVITDDTGRSHAYMHMRRPALAKRGEKVLTGQPIGEVGESGRASGCHLHFELWTAPGWYKGGEAVDPLPELRRWDAAT